MARPADILVVNILVGLARKRTTINVKGMLRRFAVLTFLALALAGCSYEYDILAVVRDGRVMFIVHPASRQRPSCLRLVEVIADRRHKAQPEVGDDASRVGYGTFWFENVTDDDGCTNRFPLIYGTALKGQHEQENGVVKAKQLLRNVVYEIFATTGATGYGSGRFVIHTDGRVENIAVHVPQ